MTALPERPRRYPRPRKRTLAGRARSIRMIDASTHRRPAPAIRWWPS